MRTVIAHNNQSLLDISIQEYGTDENVLELAIENDLSITTSLFAGQVLRVPGEPIYSSIVTYYRNKRIKPATASPNFEEIPEGVIFEAGIFEPEIFE